MEQDLRHPIIENPHQYSIVAFHFESNKTGAPVTSI